MRPVGFHCECVFESTSIVVLRRAVVMFVIKTVVPIVQAGVTNVLYQADSNQWRSM